MERLRRWAGQLKQQVYALYLAGRSPEVPFAAKLMIGLVVAYAVSPIDLIPDFIPVLGYLDDLILLPLGIWFVIKIVPADVWRECVARAKEEKPQIPSRWWIVAVIMVVWMSMVIALLSAVG